MRRLIERHRSLLGPHLFDQLALPPVVHVDPRLDTRAARDICAGGEVVGPFAVLPHEDDSCATSADVLNDRTCAAVHRGERLHAGGDVRR